MRKHVFRAIKTLMGHGITMPSDTERACSACNLNFTENGYLQCACRRIPSKQDVTAGSAYRACHRNDFYYLNSKGRGALEGT